MRIIGPAMGTGHAAGLAASTLPVFEAGKAIQRAGREKKQNR